MKVRPFVIAASLCGLTALCPAEEIIINLKDPVYCNGVVKTDQGGVIEACDLRIQARKLTYTNTKEIQKVFAEGDLMLEYKGHIFVGEKLEFDLRNKTGYLLNGRTKLHVWYMGGHLIELSDNGEYIVEDAFITTTANRANPWKMSAEDAVISDSQSIRARSVALKVGKTPILWFPFYRGSLTRFSDPPIRYRLVYDQGLGPRVSLRWRFLSTDTFNAFARFDYRFPLTITGSPKYTLGPGGALEAEYKSKNKRTLFQTRNYGALDKTFANQNGEVHYRFQGIYKTKSQDEYSRLHLQWDKLSSSRMVGDFTDFDFELNTKKATYLEAARYKNSYFNTLTVRPKINQEDSLNQELPSAVGGFRPFEILNTGIISENFLSGSYLDYSYTRQVKDTKNPQPDGTPTISKVFHDRKSGRLQTINTVYRPISFAGATVTPKAGIVGIYYTDSPEHDAAGQFLFTYGGDANFRMSRSFDCLKHSVEPYAQYLGYTRPTSPVGDHYVFDIHDGYDTLNQLRFGMRQLVYNKTNPIFLPTFSLDLYSYSFWGAESFTQHIPKIFADLEFNQPSYAILGGVGWNLQENVLDYGNAEFLWTVNANIALGVEFRHRSKFYWRKAIHDNFVVDFARPLEELLASPLSDKRNTLLTKAHLRLTPRWNMHFQSFHGWGRVNEPRYNGARVDFYTMLTGSWQMKLSYEYLPNDEYRFSYSFKLIK